MDYKRPLIIENGRLRELPVGDSLDPSTIEMRYAIPVVGTDSEGNPEIVFDSSGDLILALRREGEL
jgi:hypothetical protein